MITGITARVVFAIRTSSALPVSSKRGLVSCGSPSRRTGSARRRNNGSASARGRVRHALPVAVWLHPGATKTAIRNNRRADDATAGARSSRLRPLRCEADGDVVNMIGAVPHFVHGEIAVRSGVRAIAAEAHDVCRGLLPAFESVEAAVE